MFFSCRELSRNVERLDDPTVPLFHRCIARVHLSSCRGCRRFVAQVRATRLALPRLASTGPAVVGADQVALAAFRQWRRRA